MSGAAAKPVHQCGRDLVADEVLAATSHARPSVKCYIWSNSLPMTTRYDGSCCSWFGNGIRGRRNRALTNYMRAFGNLIHPVDFVSGVYLRHCAIGVSCCQLARAGLFLANAGRIPNSDASVSFDCARTTYKRTNAYLRPVQCRGRLCLSGRYAKAKVASAAAFSQSSRVLHLLRCGRQASALKEILWRAPAFWSS